MLESVTLHCPYCGEPFESSADCSAGSQTYIEDCAVCCQPIQVTVQVDEDGGLLGVLTRSERE